MQKTPHSPEHVVAILFRLSRDAFSGVVRIDGSAPGSTRYLRLQNGTIVDVARASPPSILERALWGKNSPLREKDRKRILKQATQSQRDPGEIVIEQGHLSDEQISGCVLAEVEAEIGELLVEEGSQLEVIDEGELPDEARGVAAFLDLAVPPEPVFLSAARRLGQWNAVKAHVSCLKDVYYATPATFALFQAQEEYPLEVAVVSLLDGERDVLEVTDRCDHDPFQCLDALQALHQNGSVELINPVQLFQLGCEFQRRGELQKSVRLLERAEDRGLDDFDLGFKLGEVYQALGRNHEAIERYLAFAEKCVGQFRIDDTILSCRKIIEIDPDNLEIQERYISLLARYGKSDEALAEGLALGRRFSRAGEFNRARTTIEKIINLVEANEEVLRFYLELCDRTGHTEGATRASRRLAGLFHQREENGKALELYQGLFVAGEDTPEVRSRLVELHFRAGNHEKAREHLHSLRQHPEWVPDQSDPEAVKFFRRLLDLDVPAPEVSLWLIDEARSRGDREETTRLLRVHRDRLEKNGDLKGALWAAERLYHLDPKCVDTARSLASLERRSGNRRRAALVLEDLVRELETGRDRAALAAVVAELIEADPYTLLGRRILLRLSNPVDDPETQNRLLMETALLELVAGNDSSAQQLLVEFESSPAAAFFAFLSGRSSLWHGDPEKALEWFHKGARLAAENYDLGLLTGLVAEIESITPDPTGEVRRYHALLAAPRPRPQTESPKVLKNGVASITARLRRLKTAPRPQPEVTAETHAGKKRVLGCVARLKSLSGDEPTESAEEPGVAALPIGPPDTGQDPVPLPPPATSDNARDGSAPGIEHPAPTTSPKKVDGAASKLSALRQNTP